jgi:hypothetical protein
MRIAASLSGSMDAVPPAQNTRERSPNAKQQAKKMKGSITSELEYRVAIT